MGYQDTYSTELTAAVVGQIAVAEHLCNLISRQVEGAAIGFGKAVKQGSADRGVAAATAAADKFRGITVRDQSVVTADQYDVKDDAMILTKGVVWVTAGATVAAGDPVYMVVGTGHAGKFTNVSTNNLAIAGAVFDSAGDADELVKVRLG